jgi:Tfp pilus assembly protein PilX
VTLRKRFGDERGVALVTAIALLFVLSISVAAMLEFTASSNRNATLGHGSERAFSVAEAGLNDALSKLAADGTALAAGTTTVSDGSATGTASYSATLSDTIWTVTSTGSVPNPTGGSPIARTVTMQAKAFPTTTTTTNGEIWKYVFTDAPVCTDLSHNANSSVWSSPIYVKGNLCLSNNIDVTGSPVMVGGTLTMNGGNSMIGSAGTPIAEAAILGGCTSPPNPHTCGNPDRVYASSRPSVLDPDLDKPVFSPADQLLWYHNAQPGPAHTCNNLGGTLPPGGFDDGIYNASNVPNTSLASVNLTPSTAYDCQFLVAGEVEGKIKWTPGSPGTLEVKGNVYFDGNIDFSNSTNAKYTGRGIIYATGRITFANGAQLCVTTNCASTWDADQHLLLLVAGSPLSQITSPNGYAISLSQGAKFQGAFMANGDYEQQNNAVTWASVVARWVSMSNSSNTYGVPDHTPLTGAPTENPAFVTIEPLPGTFRG